MLKDILINSLAPGEVDRTGERVDGKATIIGKLGYNWIAVLDAKYRYRGVFRSDSSPVRAGLHTSIKNYTTSYIQLYNKTPAQILSDTMYDPNSSSVNTAYLKTSDAGTSGMQAINRVSVAGHTISMPNVQSVLYIRSLADYIDSKDPTSEFYPQFKLSNWGFSADSSSLLVFTSSRGIESSLNLLAVARYSSSATSIQVAVYDYSTSSLGGIIPIIEIPAYEDRTGERVDDKATIIGRLGENWIAVLDAAYRTTKPYSISSAAAVDISGAIPYVQGSYVVETGWTENEILSQELYDIHSSKWNTDYLNQVQDQNDFPAAKICYDIIIDGKHAQMPNIQTLAFIYANINYIDENDPTIKSGSTSLRTAWTSSYYAHSSTSGSANRYCTSMSIQGSTAHTTQRAANYLVCPILEIPLYKDRTGERVDNKATIIGKLGNYWISVLDAVSRAKNKPFGKYETNFGLPSVAYDYLILLNWTEEVAFLTRQTVDPNTSKYNTDYFKTQNEGTDQYNIVGVPAAAHCFNIQINGQNAQLGNIQTIAFVFAHKDFVDASDPTAEANQEFKLSNWGFGSLSTYVWTSTKVGAQGQHSVDRNGTTYQLIKSTPSGVCPILEIPLWCDDNYK